MRCEPRCEADTALITQGSRVHIPPPLPKKVQVRAGFVSYHGPGSRVRVSSMSADIAPRPVLARSPGEEQRSWAKRGGRSISATFCQRSKGHHSIASLLRPAKRRWRPSRSVLRLGLGGRVLVVTAMGSTTTSEPTTTSGSSTSEPSRAVRANSKTSATPRPANPPAEPSRHPGNFEPAVLAIILVPARFSRGSHPTIASSGLGSRGIAVRTSA